MRAKRLITVTALLCLASTCLTGCRDSEGPRPPMGKVYGTVTYKGQPVPRGTITFSPVQDANGAPSGHAAIGQIGSDGSYELTTFDRGDGAVVGKHAVTVIALADGWAPSKGMPTPKKARSYLAESKLIPGRYSDPTTSPLRYTVDGGNNKIDVSLSDND